MTDRPEDRPAEGSTPPSAPVPPQPATPSPASPPPASTPPQQWPSQQSGMASSEQRNWAVGAHIGALAASILTGLAFLAPLVIFLIKKDEDAFVREHARESLNFQLTWLLGGFVATILAIIVTLVTVGFGLIVLLPAAIGFAVAWVVFMVKATMAASRGEYYRYPLTIRMVS